MTKKSKGKAAKSKQTPRRNSFRETETSQASNPDKNGEIVENPIEQPGQSNDSEIDEAAPDPEVGNPETNCEQNSNGEVEDSPGNGIVVDSNETEDSKEGGSTVDARYVAESNETSEESKTQEVDKFKKDESEAKEENEDSAIADENRGANEIKSESSSITPTTSPPKPKKRLTLQERLALAAKGKAKKTKPSSATSPVHDSSAVSTVSHTPLALSPITSNETEPIVHPKAVESTFNKLEEKIVEPKVIEASKPENEILDLKQQLADLQLKNSLLSEQLKTAEQKSKSYGMPAVDDEKRDLLNKIAAKDETIKQLMKEGEALSVKELKLNDSIKKLKAINSDLEENLHDYSSKNEESSLRLGELEDFLKIHKFKGVQQLIDSYNNLSHKLSETASTLEKELQQNWQGKYKEQQKIFEEELAARKQALKELSEVRIQFDMLKRQNQLQLDSKDSIINDLKRDISSLKLENQSEISRLENKIELLRLENESIPGSAHANGSSRGTVSGDTNVANDSEAKLVYYEDYVKLSDTHHILQNQFLSSQENWKVIESNLLTKVDSMTSTVDSLKKSNQKLSHELKKLNSSLVSKTEELATLFEKQQILSKENEELKFTIQVKESDYGELQEKLEKLKTVFNTDRANLDAKVKTLNETITKLHSILEEDLASERSADGKELGLNISGSRVPFRANSSSSIIDTPLSYNPHSWHDIRFGESSQTPAISKEFSGFFHTSHNNSVTNLTETGEESFDNVPEDYSISKYSSNILNSSASNLGPGSISGTFPATTNNGNGNIQLINKMSSNIRRLEIELNTLREENNQLNNDKEILEQELIENLKNVEEFGNLKKQIETLQEGIEEKKIKEQTMLELIGEKSEQVEELKADVFDLKELCKLQVQQMIELQESKQSMH